MTFADVSRLRLNAEVDEFDIAMVEVGMPVVITADAMGRDSLSSTVERISPAAEVINNISIFTVSTVIRSTTTVLRPGMSADIAILISDDTGLVIPANAVSSVRGRSYLDVVEDGEVVTRRVVAGATNGTNTVILEGLGEEDLVVVPQLASFSLDTPAAEPDGGSSSLLPISVPGTGGSR
jgi:HlyD family secretion protein